MPNGTFVETKIKDAYVLGAASGTVTIDLPTANYLQGLMLRVVNTNGSTSNLSETIQGCISKIEIIADGTTILSGTGRLLRKWEHYDSGDEPPGNETMAASAVQNSCFPIKFGRHAQDKDVILPAHALTTLQLRVTWAFTDSTTVGWTTSASLAKLDVIARYLYSGERTMSPFLGKKEIYNKTPASTGTEEVSLPVGAGAGSYRRIMLSCYEAAIEDGTDVTDFKLLLNDSQTVMEDNWNTHQHRNAMKYNARHTKFCDVMGANADTWVSFVSRIKSAVATSGTALYLATITAIAGDTVTYGYSDVATPTAVTTDAVLRTAIQGAVVSHAVMMDLGTDNLGDSIYVGKDSNVSSLKVKYTVGATGGDTRVMAEQLLSFA